MRATVVVLVLFLTGLFSGEIADPDFWWHLKTGQYLLDTHSLPAPDPFAFTTARAPIAYAGEQVTRYFNLTHEWLAQVIIYLAYRAGGFAGVVLCRVAMLLATCGLVGWLAWRRSGGFYRAICAMALTGLVAASGFTSDRPFLLTFLFLALTLAILESGNSRALWTLPLVMLVWANCHGGYFLGLIAMAAYSVRTPRLWVWTAISAAISGLNPNGFRLFEVLLAYRHSFLQSKLQEWNSPPLWPPTVFSVLLIATAATLIWMRSRVRLSDWLLFLAFAAAALSAQRNTMLIGILGPVLLAAYLPLKRAVPKWIPFAVPAALLAAFGFLIASGTAFQLHAADWKYPAGAAEFVKAHHLTQPIFNTYEQGGYLIWSLWPAQRVFIDGRALSESVFLDYARILYNHDESDGKSGQQLLDDYGVQLILMNGFDAATGQIYTLAPSLADPQQTTWKLVYWDPQSIVFLRNPPAGMPALDSLQVFTALEAGCGLHIEREPRFTRCARSLGQVFSKVGDYARARRWLGVYVSRPHPADPEADSAYYRLLNSGQ